VQSHDNLLITVVTCCFISLTPTVATNTALNHPVPDWVKPSFVIFDIRGLLDAQPWASECPHVKDYQWRLNPVWHRMLYSCSLPIWQQWVSKA